MSQAPTTVFDSTGGTYRLGKLLGKGGEGAVYEVGGVPGAVAKMYVSPDARRQAKLPVLTAMTSQMTATGVMRFAAWPTVWVTNSPGSPPCGFLMRRLSGHREMHTLYGPQQRMKEWPAADWRFLAHVAVNLAAALETLHAAGVVMGDVNQSNAMVAADGTVALIDCDSYCTFRDLMHSSG